MSLSSYDVDLARAAALLTSSADAGDAAAQEAETLARACVAVDATRADAHVVLARALVKRRRSDEAVKVCKDALTRHPKHEALAVELRSARFAVLNELDEEDDDQEEMDEEARGFQAETDARDTMDSRRQTSPMPTTATEEVVAPRGEANALAFEAKVERLMLHLDLKKLLRVGMWYTLQELLQLRTVVAGLVALFLGLLAQAVMHRHKVMVVSMVIVGLAHSKLRVAAEKYLHNWVHTSTDKLGAVVWLPRVVTALPIVLKIVGHLRFMVFLQRDMVLSLVVTLTSGLSVLAASSVQDETHPIKPWGYGKRLKFVAYATAIAYWAGWCGHYADTLRLLGPALMDAGGILLGSASSQDIQDVCRRAWKRVFDEVAADVQQDVAFDAWFCLGLTKWVIDYWQQPTNFSLEMLAKGLADGFASFEKHAVHLFRPELHRLGQQMRRIGRDAEFALLVAYLRQSLESVPPRKWLGLLGLAAKRCASFLVAALLLVFFGSLPPLPLVPFLVSEATDARALYALFGSDEIKPMDGLDVLLLGSPLLRVWENAKAAVYCLEGGVTLSRAVATGAQIATAAVRLSQLARFAAKVKTAGLAAHADELPEHLTSAFVVLSDFGAMADGVRHVVESAHLQDLGGSLRRWWTRGRDS